MGRAAAVFAGFWSDSDYRRASLPSKLLFLFLISYSAPSGGAVSGVYEIDIEDMAHWTGIPTDVIEALLEGRDVEVNYEIEPRKEP